MKRASEAPFPYGWPGRVLYIEQDGRNLLQISDRADMRAAIWRALAGESQIVAAWPGEYRTDLFQIDKPELLAEAIGLAVEPVADTG